MNDAQRVVWQMIEARENIFEIMLACYKQLLSTDQRPVARSLMEEALSAHSYDEALDIIKRYMGIDNEFSVEG